MAASARRVSLADIAPWRARHLKELNAQCRYDACHWRGWSDHWQLRVGSRAVGYAAIKGRDALADRDAIFEWYVDADARQHGDALWQAVVTTARPSHVECQTNDHALHAMAQRCTSALTPTTWLFGAPVVLPVVADSPGVARPRRADDLVFAHHSEPVGAIVLDVEGRGIVATGGALTHYNPPFADIFMEVAPEHRRRGYGTAIVKAVIVACAHEGFVAAARCGLDNTASRATLLRAGMRDVGQVVVGALRD